MPAIANDKRWLDLANGTEERAVCDDRESEKHVRLLTIEGGKRELEREAITALVDPARFHLAKALLSRLDRRGKLKSVACPNALDRFDPAEDHQSRG